MNTAQRKLLLRLGGWMLTNLLVDGDAGWSSIQSSMCGGTGPRGKGDSDDDVQSYEVRGGKITGRLFDGTPVALTKATALKWLKSSVTVEQRAELAAVRAAQHDEQRRTEAWCHCPVQRNVEGAKCFGRAAYLPQSYHPTDAEDQEHLRISRDLRDREKQVVIAALHLLPEPQPGEQMDLFA